MKKTDEIDMKELDKEDERRIRIKLITFRNIYKNRTGKEPDEKMLQKERKRIIKEYISEDKEGLRQVDKEDGQMRCLLGLLRDEGKHLSLEEMSQRLINSGFTVGSSVKTIYRRILPELLQRGAVKDDEKRYYIPEYRRDSRLEEQMNKKMEERMETVSIISNFLDTLKDTPVYEKAKEYIDRDYRFSRHRINRKEETDYEEDTYVSRVIFMGAPAANVQSDIWEIIHFAMMEYKIVLINYIAEDRKEPSQYTVKPYQLIFDNGFWELWGESTTFEHKGKRLFNLSRILDVQVIETAEKFELPENYDFRSTLAGCFGCYNDNIIENYSIKFKKGSYAYKYIKDRIWGEFQEIRETEGGYILEFEATQYKPILRWVLGWGPDAEPLEPQKLVDEWKEKIREMGKMI